MEFRHHREIHSILKDYNPMAKICRKDSWSVHTCGRKRLASPRLVKIRKDFKPLQVPREKLIHGIGNRLTTKPDRKGKPVSKESGPDKSGNADSTSELEGLPGRLLLPVSSACESLRTKLQKLVSDSEHRKRQCLNGGTCRASTPTITDGKNEPPKLGSILHPGSKNSSMGSPMDISENASAGDTFVTQTEATGSDPLRICQPELPGVLKPQKSEVTVKKVNSKALVDELPAVQLVTAKEVMEQATINGEEGLFFPRTRDVFEQSAEKPILRYVRQHGTFDDKNVDKTTTTFSDFKRNANEHLTQFYDRSGLELERYNSESRLLFEQKYATLGIERLCVTKSAKVAVATMEAEIRNQHSRASSIRRHDQQKDWVVEFKSILAPFPKSAAVKEIVAYLEEHINNSSDELSTRHFEILLSRFSRAHLLLSEVMSLLYAIRPIFKLSPESFVEIVRDRLRPLYPKRIDHTSFDHKFKNWMYNRRIKMIVQSFDEDEDGKLNYREFRSLLGKAFAHDDGLKKSMLPESEQTFAEFTLKLGVCPPGGFLDSDALRRLFDSDFFKAKEDTLQRLESHTNKRLGVLDVVNVANKIKGLVSTESFSVAARRGVKKASQFPEQRKVIGRVPCASLAS